MGVDSLQAVDLPRTVDFDQLSAAQDTPIQNAISDHARGVVHLARRGRQTLDEIPKYVDSNLPTWAKVIAFPALATAGQSIGIFKRSYDLVSDLPVAFIGIMDGRVSLSDVVNGAWQMVKDDIGAVPEVVQHMLEGRIMTAGSRVGEVAFDVAPFLTGIGGALKSVPRAVTQFATRGLEAGKIAVRGALATFDDLTSAAAQTLRLEPEFAMAGIPTRFRPLAVAPENIPTNALAMCGRKPHPTWQTQPIGLAEAPAKKWRPSMEFKKTPKPPSFSLDRFNAIQNMRNQLGLESAEIAQLERIVSNLPPNTPVHPNAFGLIFNGPPPEGLKSLGTVTSKGQRFAVCYEPATTKIFLVTR